MSSTETLKMRASPDSIYELLADVTRMGEWSPECYRCEWTHGSSRAASGATFTGYNRLGPFKWQTECVVEAAEPGRAFTFIAGDEKEGKTRWTYRLERNGSGAAVSESYDTIIPAPLFIRIAERVMALGRSRDFALRKGMRQTLERIRAAAESG